MAGAKPATAAGDVPTESFEEAFANLEAIVEAMESDKLPLEDLVKHYEKGTECLNRCEAILNVARDRIKLITLRNQGEISLEAGAAATEAPQPPAPSGQPGDSDDDDDIRLF